MTIRYHTQHQARALASQIFVNDMPFNQVPGLQLIQQKEAQAVITFENKPILTGNIARKIFHGGVIASVLDVTAGLVCVSYALSRQETISVGELKQRLSRMDPIDLKVDYLRPGRGKIFTATGQLLRGGNKIAVARVELHNEQQVHIPSGSATYLVG